MGKKKHAEHVNHERWLVSYADLLTLLFAFFVVLFASSVSDKKKTTEMKAAMQTAFSQHGIFDAHASTPPLSDGAGNSQGMPMPIMLPTQTALAGDGSSKNSAGMAGDAATQSAAKLVADAQAKAAEVKAAEEAAKGAAGLEKELQKELRKDAGASVDPKSVTVANTSEGTVISLHEAGFFASGSADLQPATYALLKKISATLPDTDVRVEGHTDNMPIHTDRYQSNWELSTARAAAIGAALMAHSHIRPEHFSLAGYGPFRPTHSNATPEGRAQNRRVDIVLLAVHTTAAPAAATTTIALNRRDAGVQRAPAPAGLMGISASFEQSLPPAHVPLAQQLATSADRAAASH